MFSKTRQSLLLGTALMLASPFSLAAVSADQAASLGTTLTPMGAEKAGNASGTIPAWDGGLKQNDQRYQNPFAGEQPLFTITADNVDQYADKLSPGQIALFKRYPDSFKMPVYPTHRTASLPDDV